MRYNPPFTPGFLRRNDLAVEVDSFFLLLMFGFLCGILGAFLSVAALILLIQSKREFAGHDRAD